MIYDKLPFDTGHRGEAVMDLSARPITSSREMWSIVRKGFPLQRSILPVNQRFATVTLFRVIEIKNNTRLGYTLAMIKYVGIWLFVLLMLHLLSFI